MTPPEQKMSVMPRFYTEPQVKAMIALEQDLHRREIARLQARLKALERPPARPWWRRLLHGR